jgi:ABC-type bacteriocin/lantibiotic exporter with double-glycine peptidase domain
MGIAMGGIQMIESMKASGGEDDFFSKWSGQHAKVMNAEQKMAVSSQIIGSVPSLLTALNTTAILGLGALRVMDGNLTVGMLVAFQSLMLSFIGPINGIVRFADQLQTFRGDLNRLDDVLAHEEDPVTNNLQDSHLGTARLSGAIKIESLSFGYSRLSPPIIEDFSIDLKPGSRVALVGGSGSGKSTVARLVAGLRQPWEGRILFDGKSREEIPRPLLSSSLAVVDQDICLFEGTVRDNLTMWDETISDEDVTRAAKDACIHDDIVLLPGGYEGIIQEGGRNLSGGQRQRMEIARALTRGPAALILDEATSALDTATEQIIDRNLRRRGCTCLIVAHRLSTIRDCDEIIVLDRGVVVERGTHESLWEAQGHYASLVGSM